MIRRNDPGHVRSRSPLLVVMGSADTTVVPARVLTLVDQLCRIGQVTQLTVLAGADHGTELTIGANDISAWLNARFAGQRAPNSCPRH